MSYTYTDKIKFAYTPNFDAFSRLRVSNPLTLFDSSNRYRDNGLWATSGSGTATFNPNEGLVDLAIGTAAGNSVTRETYRVFSYQPGKSLLALNTFVFNPAKSGLLQRVGYYGASNGVFLELSDSSLSLVERSSVTGVLVDTLVPQASWNVDPMDGLGPSGVTLDITKAQILWMDFEWLGVGSVRCGFVVDGEFYTCHVFHHSNIISSTYITTATLPLRYEISNTSATASASTLKQICSSVISEGGYELRGDPYAIGSSLLSPYSLLVAGTYYPVVSLRLKSTRLDGVAVPTGLSILPQDTANYSYRLAHGGTTTGGTWVSAGANSQVEYNISGTSFAGGTVTKQGFFAQTNQASAFIKLERGDVFGDQLSRNSFTSTPLEFTLLVASETVGGGGNQVWGSLDWEEITR